jgi:hypothetical protein
MRRIIGQGKGWVDRLEQALKSGAVLPATATVSAALQNVRFWHKADIGDPGNL